MPPLPIATVHEYLAKISAELMSEVEEDSSYVELVILVPQKGASPQLSVRSDAKAMKFASDEMLTLGAMFAHENAQADTGLSSMTVRVAADEYGNWSARTQYEYAHR